MRKLSKIKSVKSKIRGLTSGIVILLIVSQLVLSLVMIRRLVSETEKSALENYDKGLINSSQIAMSIAEYNYAQYQNGQISENQMKEAIKNEIISMRFNDGNGYLWIDDSEGVCVAHPVTENTGQERINNQDANGVYYIQEIIKAGDSGEGFSEYSFPKIDSGDVAYAKRAYTQKFEPLGWYISTGDYIDDIEARVSVTREMGSNIFIALAVVIIALGFFFVFIFSKFTDVFTVPLERIDNQIQKFSAGEPDLMDNIRNMKVGTKEFIGLKESAFKLSEILMKLTSELKAIAEEHKAGNTNAFMNIDEYEGMFKEVAIGVNEMLGAYITDNKELLRGLRSISAGDFNAEIRQFSGYRGAANKIIDELRGRLKNISSQINYLIESASEGDLSVRADIADNKGDWKHLLEGLNNLMEGFQKPVDDLMISLNNMAKGKLDSYIETEYSGVFDDMKYAANNMSKEISSYISEISGLLNEMAHNYNYSNTITREYLGDFEAIRISINDMVNGMSEMLSTMRDSSHHMLSGNNQVSESAAQLSMGADTQIQSINSLAEAISSMDESIINNTESTREATKLVAESQFHAKEGGRRMGLLLDAVTEVETYSKKMNEIMKTLNDIAFQTNLLALNAAVEASRAGQYGKGFTVVAEEVRNLSVKSKESADETTGLIENSLKKIQESVKFAGQTSQSFNIIANDIDKVTDIVEKVAEVSEKQVSGVEIIRNSINNIVDVSQNNAAMSEELAAATEELSSQNAVLNNLIDKYVI
ncbi:methyl-accepting chemotaxis protein [Anaeropeptidivorans aminofermentans]|uniref:methyl-accepting chemotaxis protein n=1 Tax=Anaeropeptidivorans aminofermentans TaxID=2934315 RepID=UPI0020253F06|nr:methyl-accepting chemotaxis protein [Anaeropeptidivorans aminofermentans]